MPSAGIRTALELYQPSGPRGIMLKRLLPYLHRLPAVRKRLGMTSMSVGLSAELTEAIGRAFGVGDFEFSVFEGTPSVHRKATLQIFRRSRILGYVKLTDSPAIAALFDHEQSLLAELHGKGVNNIPRCLYNGLLPSGLRCFIQSTVKTRKSVSPRRWTPLHEQFLAEMRALTASDILFDRSDFAMAIKEMTAHIDFLPPEFRAAVARSIDDVMARYSGRVVSCSAYHADFTPWNMFVENGRLYVFDWEYGRMTYPPMLDRYHFFVQQAIHVGHQSPAEIRALLEGFDWFSEDDLRLYLLDVITRFTMRENGKTSQSLISMLEIWTKLLPG